MVDDHSYKILHFYDEHIMDELASAISAGECVIFDDIDDSIDLSLRDLLEKNFICKYAALASGLTHMFIQIKMHFFFKQKTTNRS